MLCKFQWKGMRQDQAQRCKRDGLEIQPPGDCSVKQVMRRTYIEATKELKGDFRRRTEA